MNIQVEFCTDLQRQEIVIRLVIPTDVVLSYSFAWFLCRLFLSYSIMFCYDRASGAEVNHLNLI